MNAFFESASARIVEWQETVALLRSIGLNEATALEAAAILLADRWSEGEVVR